VPELSKLLPAILQALATIAGWLLLSALPAFGASEGTKAGTTVLAAPVPPALVDIDRRLFPSPPQIADNVDFWTMVYSRYTSDQVLLHDELYLGIVYAVLDFSELKEKEVNPVRIEQIRRQQIRESTEKYRAILHLLADGEVSKSWPEDAGRVTTLFAKVPGGRERYRAAAERLRTQTCLKDRFAEGIVRSGRYMAEIERIFKEGGLPLDLTRLPFVESLFQWNARSTVAAGGIWQFMPGTGRLFGLRSQSEFDERYDPLRATHAASRLLADNFKALGTWPLAITAYNHGQGGMRRAVRTMGTRDMGVIATTYTGRAFGFASRNFYAEFLAAAHVYANRLHYFPETSPAPALRFDEFALGHYVKASDLARRAEIDVDDLRDLNPAVARAVWEGRLRLPKGYRLKVPQGSLPVVTAAYGALPAEAKLAGQGGGRHVVRSGDTLGRIANRYGTTVAALTSSNRLSTKSVLRVGQELVVPGREEPATPTPPAAILPSPPTGPGIAVAESAPTPPRDESPAISAPPAAAPQVAPRTAPSAARAKQHVVRRGDSLSSIATRYGVSVDALRRTNRLRGSVIHPRQVLTIP
jgi:membrane-bound lytic murein transglycosylase D